MRAYPLEAPLDTLSPAARVYVLRAGRAYLYPASIMRDIANDRYVVPCTDWNPTTADWGVGTLLHDRLGAGWDLVDHARLFALTLTIWRTAGAFDETFLVWWDSVNPDAHPEWIGAAARLAARELMTTPMFQQRHLLDDSITA